MSENDVEIEYPSSILEFSSDSDELYLESEEEQSICTTYEGNCDFYFVDTLIKISGKMSKDLKEEIEEDKNEELTEEMMEELRLRSY